MEHSRSLLRQRAKPFVVLSQTQCGTVPNLLWQPNQTWAAARWGAFSYITPPSVQRAHVAMSKIQKISGTPDVAQLMRAADRSTRRSLDARYATRLQASKPAPPLP